MSSTGIVIFWKYIKHQGKISKIEWFSHKKGAEGAVNGLGYLAKKPKSPSQNMKSKRKFCSVMWLGEQTEVEVAENLPFALV